MTTETEEQEVLELVKPGCLGTCWFGHYHYVEPWVGCHFDCAYCYARHRSPVKDKLKEMGTEFGKPVLYLDREEMLEQLAKDVREMNVERVKLSRYTDVFCPEFLENDVTYGLLKTLLDSPVERIIITTKSKPDGQIVELMKENPKRFSLSMVFKPEGKATFENHLPPVEEKLAVMAEVEKAGVLSTIHIDPLVPPIEDDPDSLSDLFKKIKSFGIKRVMFSYLLLNDDLLGHMRKELPGEIIDEIMGAYASQMKQVLPGQPETNYISYKPELKTESVNTIAKLLKDMDFDFVLCSLKSITGDIKVNRDACTLCDGKFYA